MNNGGRRIGGGKLEHGAAETTTPTSTPDYPDGLVGNWGWCWYLNVLHGRTPMLWYSVPTNMEPNPPDPGLEELLNTTSTKPPILSERDRAILALYDEEEEIRLEKSLIEARHALPDQDVSEDDVDALLQAAEREALEARAAYLIRNKIVQSVLVTDPVLKAVHAGLNTTPAERKLLPLLHQRDILAMYHTTLTSTLSTVSSAVTAAERDNIAANKKNQQLTATLLELVEATKPQATEDVQDTRIRAQLQTLDSELRAARKRWRVMKGVVSGVIVGSGVDWASDEGLRELVMDDEEELG
ncbi:hypothetical protein B0A49_08288 [Cryomyces minteri]|uniref:Centromere protein H C-terminal domain-containing protein n=1 Tax=Cryomyces minteri TaxID=331657 RepID=A0A4U0WMD9_9PEZI|nr:hypothetical protein B0A49_08288 [Cryomyces minteri]